MSIQGPSTNNNASGGFQDKVRRGTVRPIYGWEVAIDLLHVPKVVAQLKLQLLAVSITSYRSIGEVSIPNQARTSPTHSCPTLCANYICPWASKFKLTFEALSPSWRLRGGFRV